MRSSCVMMSPSGRSLLIGDRANASVSVCTLFSSFISVIDVLMRFYHVMFTFKVYNFHGSNTFKKFQVYKRNSQVLALDINHSEVEILYQDGSLVNITFRITSQMSGNHALFFFNA